MLKTQALLIKQKFNKFLFSKRREHPPLEVLIRPRNPTLPIFPIPFHPPNFQINHSSRGPRENCSSLLVGTTSEKPSTKNHPANDSSMHPFTQLLHKLTSNHHSTFKNWNHHTNVICQSSRHLQSPDIWHLSTRKDRKGKARSRLAVHLEVGG